MVHKVRVFVVGVGMTKVINGTNITLIGLTNNDSVDILVILCSI
jgi:hypothetical protein